MKYYQAVSVNKSFVWDDIYPLNDFTSPWRDKKKSILIFKACYDHAFFYFQFEVACPTPLFLQVNNNREEVLQSERVELFFRSDSSMIPYCCLEIDVLGRVFDHKADHYRRFDYDWRWPSSINITSRMSESGYTIDGKLKLSDLNNLGLIKDNAIQVGLFRAHCEKIKSGIATFEWVTWVDPKKHKPDFHIPEVFGIIELA